MHRFPLQPAWRPALPPSLCSPASEGCSRAGPGIEVESHSFPSTTAKWKQQTGRTAGLERTNSWTSEKLICWLICLQTANGFCNSLPPSAPQSKRPGRREDGPSSCPSASCAPSWQLHTPCPAHSRRTRKTTWFLHTHFLLTPFPERYRCV